MKIINDCLLEPYIVRPGDGSMYSYLDYIEIDEIGITFTIIMPQEKMERKILITDLTCIELLPSLLIGKISCFQAIQNLEEHLSKKHIFHSKYSDPCKRPSELVHRLCHEDSFAELCLFIPHTYEDRLSPIYKTPVKAANEEIITAIRNNFFLSTPNTLQNIVTGFVKNNMLLFSSNINTQTIARDIINSIESANCNIGDVVYSVKSGRF